MDQIGLVGQVRRVGLDCIPFMTRFQMFPSISCVPSDANASLNNWAGDRFKHIVTPLPAHLPYLPTCPTCLTCPTCPVCAVFRARMKCLRAVDRHDATPPSTNQLSVNRKMMK
jgi:hypothetical protein